MNNNPIATHAFETIPFRGQQPYAMIADLVALNALDLNAEERLWVPQSEHVSYKPLCFCVSQGYYVNLLRVRTSGVLSRHRHTGPVHAFVLRGRWQYMEHDWVAQQGSYVFEPPGETHTLTVPADVPEMITLFHVSGGYVYVDPDGRAVGYEDVFTKLENARRHFAQVGLGAEYADQFVR